MKYYGIVEIDADGSASGYFPDVPGCLFAGDNTSDAYLDAQSAIEAHFDLMAEKGIEIPQSNGVPAIDPITFHLENRRVMMIEVNVDVTKYLGKSERINITMPHLLIEKIDKVVGKDSRYTSRSHFLAEAARKELSNV